jgi:hemerythrin-like domain-containing protein
MRTTEILMNEHRVIETVLACLERMADETQAKKAIPAADAHDAVRFLTTFADRCHHMKEEDRLFPAMERCGMPREAGPTAVMREEHELGRGHVRRMDDAIKSFEAGQGGAAERFVREARAFVELLREHIAKEDQILFPMAERMLPAAVHDELLTGFAHAEEAMGAGTHEEFVAVAERLAQRYGVTPALTAAKARTCACSHGH